MCMYIQLSRLQCQLQLPYTCTMYMYHVHVPRTETMYMYHVHVYVHLHSHSHSHVRVNFNMFFLPLTCAFTCTCSFFIVIFVHCGSLAPVQSHKPASPSRVSASCPTSLHHSFSGSGQAGLRDRYSSRTRLRLKTR